MSFPLHDVTQGALLEALAREMPDGCAVQYPRLGRTYTYAELDAWSRQLARGLVALGVERGDRIAVWAVNVPEWLAFQFAIARIGAVLVTANPQLTPKEMDYLLRQSRTSVLVGQGSLLARAPLPETLRHAVAIDGPVPSGALCLDELVRRGEAVPASVIDARSAATSPDEPANIQYTSGTTGFPKGVVLTHRNIVENAYAMSRVLDVRHGERLLLMVPLFHCFGCSVVVLGAFTHAATLVAFERFDPAAVLESWAGGHTADLVYGVPTMFRALLDHPLFRSVEPARRMKARGGIMGGAPCPEPLMRRVIDEMGCHGMVVGYGLTEASPGCTTSHPGDPVEVRCGTIGHALPGVEVRVVDPGTGAACAVGEAGEIQARGPNVMRGYFDMPEATAAAITADGWLRTGDLGTVDASGLFRIAGRLKEMIKRGGENVYPAEVEDAIRTHPAVADAAVFGVPSEFWGEEVASAVIRRPGAALEAAELHAFLESRLAKFKRPTRVAFLEAFPLTGSGKVRKFKLPEVCGF